ncbi:prolyl oligopeptidase family serine peptidase [Pedobacter sp. JY14-1]|uniref:alpha/beta hydrolase family protein n=1 Tax=Pedobacter sp. JY14-1 TaxID=3034151 RepID=UPI0023E1696E|nr:prolyl oligopeptidase family serine peptidase [Pedobacter sp. JY14-1]
MKKALSLILFLFGWQISFCQYKPLLTLDSYKSWNYVSGGDLSLNAKYALFIETLRGEGKTALYVKSTSGKLVSTRPGVVQAEFSSDSKFVIETLPGDSLSLLNISSNKYIDVPDVSSYELRKWNNVQRIFCRSKGGGLRIIDFEGRAVLQIDQVTEYQIPDEGTVLYAICKDSAADQDNLVRIDAHSGKRDLLYRDYRLSGLILSEDGSKLAFLPSKSNLLGYYQSGMTTAEVIPVSGELKVSTDRYWSFNRDGSQLLFTLVKNALNEKNNNNLNLEIWSYEDRYLQSYSNRQAASSADIHHCLTALNLSSKQFRQLTNDNQIILPSTFSPLKSDYCIVQLQSKTFTYFLCNLRTGELTALKENTDVPHYRWWVSPLEKYIVYYDYDEGNYFSYCIEDRQKTNISKDIMGQLLNYLKLHYPNRYNYPLGVLGWTKNDRSLLIQGTYDIWRVDPQAMQQPVNLTNGQGERERTVFRPAFEDFDANSEIPLTAFDTRTKDYGFYKLIQGAKMQLEKLSMQTCYLAEVYEPLRTPYLSGGHKGFLLNVEQSAHAPNYFFSKDLRSFTPISNVQPELHWNWIRAELHTYKDSLGNTLQGLLYKPENFDPEKKYPVVFGVYEFQSNHLNSFLSPDPAGAMFGIPWMVSNGYLVFLPDIKAVPRYGGDGLTRCIIAGADHLSQFNWADTARMGIAGHSVGGFVTNYAITHCSRFKAALSGAGISNMITASTDLWADGTVKQEFLKDAVYMMDVNMSDDISAYVRNSPILYAKNVTTPLLLLHNDQDGNVRFEQSRSFFIVLRSLNKVCWWLNYKGKAHQLLDSQDVIDYNIKVMDFFNHYLKGTSMPDWMKEHI